MAQKKKPEKLLTIKEALELIANHYGRPMFTARTIYNRIGSGKLTRHGPRHMVLLDQAEIESTMMK